VRLLESGFGQGKVAGRWAVVGGSVRWWTLAALSLLAAFALGPIALVDSVVAQTAGPSIDVDLTVSVAEKVTGDTAGKVEEGEVVTYTLNVTNTGNAVLNSVGGTVTVNSASPAVTVSCDDTTLAVQASTTCTVTRELPSTDFDGNGVPTPATMTSDASVTGTPPGDGDPAGRRRHAGQRRA